MVSQEVWITVNRLLSTTDLPSVSRRLIEHGEWSELGINQPLTEKGYWDE